MVQEWLDGLDYGEEQPYEEAFYQPLFTVTLSIDDGKVISYSEKYRFKIFQGLPGLHIDVPTDNIIDRGDERDRTGSKRDLIDSDRLRIRTNSGRSIGGSDFFDCHR